MIDIKFLYFILLIINHICPPSPYFYGFISFFISFVVAEIVLLVNKNSGIFRVYMRFSVRRNDQELYDRVISEDKWVFEDKWVSGGRVIFNEQIKYNLLQNSYGGFYV